MYYWPIFSFSAGDFGYTVEQFRIVKLLDKTF